MLTEDISTSLGTMVLSRTCHGGTPSCFWWFVWLGLASWLSWLYFSMFHLLTDLTDLTDGSQVYLHGLPPGIWKGGCIFSISRDMAVSIKRCQREGQLLFISIFLHLLRYEFSCASSLGIYHLYFPSSLLPPVQLLRRVLKQSVAMTRRLSAVAWIQSFLAKLLGKILKCCKPWMQWTQPSPKIVKSPEFCLCHPSILQHFLPGFARGGR